MLARCWNERRDALAADFQQTYSINIYAYGLDGEVPDEDAAWLASLCMELPRDARVRVADDPDLAWDDATRMQRAIDYRLQSIQYMLSSKGAKKPRPIETPSEALERAEAFDRAEESRSLVDEILGFSLQGGEG